jgi:hypothetical protein
MAQSKRKAPADGDRQGLKRGSENGPYLTLPYGDVKPLWIEVNGLGKVWRGYWTQQDEWWILDHHPDHAVWRSRTCVYVYFVEWQEWMAQK